MSYRAPLHIAVVNVSSRAQDREVSIWTEAVAKQLGELAEVWGIAPPGIALYSREVKLPREDGLVLAVADTDGDPDTAGYHSPLGAVIDMSQSAVPSRTMSHEALEMATNWALDRWKPGPFGRLYAVEVADPVQRESYRVPVQMFGLATEVEVSNWVTPAWFDDNAGPPYDRLDQLDAPFSMSPGGYAIAQDAEREVVFLAHPGGASFGARKFRGSRTRRIIEAAG